MLYAFSYLPLTEDHSLGKPYTKSPAPSGSFPDTGNVELTNGILPSVGSYTDAGWVGWQYANPVIIRVDLGSSKLFTHLAVWLLHNIGLGIYVPSSINIHGSDDDAAWNLIGTFVPTSSSGWHQLVATATYRYIRFTLNNAAVREWIFCGEVLVQLVRATQVQSMLVPAGRCAFKLWGAKGYMNHRFGVNYGYGGKGGYAEGFVTFPAPTTVYIYVGGGGDSFVTAGGWNGGGPGANYGGGGGATDIRTGAAALANRIMIAAGGGGGGYGNNGGGGGGLVGINGFGGSPGTGGTQAAGGNRNGALGLGGDALGGAFCGGGGGGLYGGGGARDYYCGGGGGSSYLGGADGYVPTDALTTANIRDAAGYATLETTDWVKNTNSIVISDNGNQE